METTRITTIDSIGDLNREKAELRNAVAHHKKSISSDIEGIRHDLSPVRQAVRMAGGLFKSPDIGNNNFARVAAGTAVDLVLYRFFLRKSPLLVKFIVPVLVKNLLGNYVDRHQAEWSEKLSKGVANWKESRRLRQQSRFVEAIPHPDADTSPNEAYLPAQAQHDSTLPGAV